MNIGIVVSVLKNAGPINVVRAQLSSMCLPEVSFYVFCLSDDIDEEIKLELSKNRVEVIQIKGSILRPIDKITLLKKEVFKRNICILHSHGVTADFFCTFLPSALKKISTAHNRMLEDYIPQFGIFKAMLLFIIHRLCYFRFDMVISCSKSVGFILSKYSIPNVIIPNGIDFNKYHPLSEKDKNVLRLKLGIAVSGKVYFYSGSFNKRKNILSLLDKLVISDDDIFILAGGGHLFNECVEKYRNDDRYVFLGQLKSCKEYYQISDVCVSASLSEGLPLALIEAYCSGARLLVSSIPSHVELFELAKGVNIRLFDLDAPSICYEDFFYSSEKNVVENQIAFFSAQRMSEKYYKLYQELI